MERGASGDVQGWCVADQDFTPVSFYALGIQDGLHQRVYAPAIGPTLRTPACTITVSRASMPSR